MSKPTNREKGDKKKKNVPISENAKAKMEYMELDEEEVEHLRQLDMKYRDRAKERREGLAADEELENDEENLLIENSDSSEEEVFTTTRGLDFDLLRKTKEKEIREKEDDEEMGVEETAIQKREIKGGFKTNLGANIHRILFKETTVKETRRNIFKSSNNCYEFDVDVNFGSNLPKLVIRNRENKTETEPLVSFKIGDNVLGKINKIMTYIKSGKKVEVKKDLTQQNNAPKTKDSIFNPISSYNMDDDEDDEDSIFPGARKRVKADEGPKTAVMLTPEEKKQVNSEVRSDQPIVKGIFDMVRTAKDTEKKMEVEEEDILGSKKIAEKNRQLIEELARKKAEEKLHQLQSRDGDYYMECFIKETPKLEDLKNEAKGGKGGKQKSGKSKKKGLNKQFDQVTRIMNEKRGGGGGGGE